MSNVVSDNYYYVNFKLTARTTLLDRNGERVLRSELEVLTHLFLFHGYTSKPRFDIGKAYYVLSAQALHVKDLNLYSTYPQWNFRLKEKPVTQSIPD